MHSPTSNKRHRTPLEMLVRVLEAGERITFEGHTYAMAEDGSLCTIAVDDNNVERGMRVDCDLAGLKRLAHDIGSAELWLKCCAISLRDM